MIEKQHGGMPPPKRAMSNISNNIERMHLLTTTTINELIVPEYTIGSNTLWVFLNGKKEYVDIDYHELTSTVIKFTFDIPSKTDIEILIFN